MDDADMLPSLDWRQFAWVDVSIRPGDENIQFWNCTASPIDVTAGDPAGGQLCDGTSPWRRMISASRAKSGLPGPLAASSTSSK